MESPRNSDLNRQTWQDLWEAAAGSDVGSPVTISMQARSASLWRSQPSALGLHLASTGSMSAFQAAARKGGKHLLSLSLLSGKKVGSAELLCRVVGKVRWLLLAVRKAEAVSISFAWFLLVKEGKGGSGSEYWVHVCFATITTQQSTSGEPGLPGSEVLCFWSVSIWLIWGSHCPLQDLRGQPMSVTAPTEMLAAGPDRRLQHSFGCCVAYSGDTTLCSLVSRHWNLSGETFPMISPLFRKSLSTFNAES